jgi:protein SCO1
MRSGPAPGGAPSRRPLVLLLVIVVSGSLVLGLLVLRPHATESQAASHAAGLRADVLPQGLDGQPAPRIRLADAAGGTVDTSSLAGRPYLVTFLYSTCPDVCPLIAEDLRTALDDLGSRRGDVAVVAVSVDPRGDTRASVREFLRRHRLPANFHYGIGSKSTLAPIWKDWYAAPQISDHPETSSHTAAVWLVDARGTLRGMFPAGASLAPRDVAHDLRALLAES